MHKRGAPFGPGRGFGPGPSPDEDGAGEHAPLFSRRGYHHGQLRAALLHAARNLLADRGTGAFSLADAAKIAGVSAAAPYRHFRDREALLGEVAREGFAAFATRLGAALRGARDPHEGFLAMGRAYLAFAREEPGLYAAMFSLDAPLDDAGARQADEAFRILLDGISSALETLRRQTGGGDIDVRTMACQVWALSHGVATLARAGRIGGAGGADAETVLLSGVEALLQGALAATSRRPLPTGVWNKPGG
jgi:AcrR family transcriptional regulator